MKAILFSIGTRGDIEPFLAIAQLLNINNWDVICVFPEQFRKTVEDMGIPFKGFGKEFRPRRTVLYLPAAKARAIEKARTLPADTVIRRGFEQDAPVAGDH